jgi:uncharacterized protein
MVCGDEGLASLDRELAAAYTAVLSKVPAAERPQLRAEQREWLKWRDGCAPYRSPDEGKECLRNAYSMRLSHLKTGGSTKRAPAPDLEHYRIESVETHDLGGRSRFGVPADYHLYNNVLYIEGLAAPIPVGRSALERELPDTEPERVGFDPSTLQLRWLHRERLLWISWRTYSLGRGQYSKEGHVILLIEEGNVAKEMFRDSIYANGCAGSSDCGSFSLDFTYDPAERILTLTRHTTETTSTPTSIQCDCDDCEENQNYGAFHRWDSWRYRLRKGVLQLIGGASSVQFEGHCRVADIARLMNVPLRRLERMNGWGTAQKDAAGPVAISTKTAPYRPEHDDGICHDKPCD